jgi:exonuclease III
MAKQKIQTTIIGSINIQSAKGNSKYLKNVLNTCDILCIQEHWLLSLEKKMLENMHKDFNVSAKAVDDDDIKLNYKSLRRNGGIVVFWKKTIDNAVKIKYDGGSRIQVITINNVPTMLCIVNVYMPSDIKEGDYEYRDMMDQLNEVIQKYEETYILLCGDMNASLHRDDRRRDRIFKNFSIESNLILPTNYPIDFTFHHHNGKGKSQIDYILFKGKTSNLQPRVSIIPFDAINTSDHTLTKVEITTQISKLAPKSAKIYTKPAWDKCNSDEYKKIIQTEIRKHKNTIELLCCRQNSHTRKYITQGRQEGSKYQNTGA